MSDLDNRRACELKEYREMTDDQLRQILRSDAQNTEGEETDVEQLLEIMEELACRRKERNECKDPEQALESFWRNYEPESGARVATRRKRTVTPLLRTVAAAAAAVIIVIGGTVTAKAFGFDVFEIVGKWTKETFHFKSGDLTSPVESGDGNTQPYESVQVLLDQYGVEQRMVPNWIPEGYALVDVQMQETPERRCFTAVYGRGQERLEMQIDGYLRGTPDISDQWGEVAECYESAGISYYLYQNGERLCAVWTVETYSCCISGEVTAQEMKKMIESISES